MTSPPRPPSPPFGPPHGSYFSRRKLMQPRPPSPAVSFTVHSSTNIRPTMQKGRRLPRECQPQPTTLPQEAATCLDHDGGSAAASSCDSRLHRHRNGAPRSEEHTSELQSRLHL